MYVDPPFDPTPPHPLRYVPAGGFDGVRHIADKAAARVLAIPLPGPDHADPDAEIFGTAPPGTSTLRDYCQRHRIAVRGDRKKVVAYKLIEMTYSAGLSLERIPDERVGRLNCYPLPVLDRWKAGLPRKAHPKGWVMP